MLFSHFLQGHSEIFLHQQLQRVHYEKMHVKKATHPGKKMPNVIPRPDPNVDNRGFNIQQGQLRRQYAYDPSIEVVPNSSSTIKPANLAKTISRPVNRIGGENDNAATASVWNEHGLFVLHGPKVTSPQLSGTSPVKPGNSQCIEKTNQSQWPDDKSNLIDPSINDFLSCFIVGCEAERFPSTTKLKTHLLLKHGDLNLCLFCVQNKVTSNVPLS